MTAYSVGDELYMRAAHEAFARTLGANVIAVLRKAFRQVARDLATQSLSLGRRAELTAFLARAGAALGGAYAEAAREAEAHLRTLARVQAGATTARMNEILGSQQTLLTLERVEAIVRLPIQDLTLGEWWQREAVALTQRVRSTIQMGLLQGQPLGTIVRSIVGDDPRTPSAYRAAKARAMTVARTTSSAVATATDRAVFEALGPNVTERYIYRATLDSRTSRICASTDGRIFNYGDADALYPPLHANCRSTIIPLVKVDRPATARKVATAQGTRETRLAPPRRLSDYTRWLRSQPAKVQDEILGTSAEQWRTGGLTLTQAMATNRRTYSVAQFTKAMQPRKE